MPTASLWVRIDLTQQQAAAETGSLRLDGSTGGYTKTIAISSNFQANPAPDDTVDVHFESVPIKASYSLTYISSDGSETTVVPSSPFNSLKDDSLPAGSNDSPAPTPGS